MRPHWRYARVGLLLITFAWLTACASVKDGGFARPAAPVLPVTSEDLQPGLAVLYFPKTFVRHLDNLPLGPEAIDKGVSGAPIENLDRRFGRGQVFRSGTNRGIGVEMSGWILLDQPGRYQFQVNSNDGFRIYMNGGLLLEDPVWHSSGDRMTPPAGFEVVEPGWYSLRIRYFQRKGTATFQFFWQRPRTVAFVPVPGRVLAHRTPY
jgi:hypothetical protein